MKRANEKLNSTDLLQLRLFQGENAEAIEWALDGCQIRDLALEEILLKPSQENDSLFVVLEGELKIQIEEDGVSPIAVAGPGDCVGELSVLENKHTTAFVIAAVPSSVLVLNRDVLWQLINRSHAVARNMLLMLSSRVRTNSQTLNESLELQRLYKKSSNIDALTGLHNRRWLMSKLSEMLETHRSSLKLSVLMMDIDHFKQYNDTHGHLAGDHAINAVASCVSRSLRAGDGAARYGGEEFVGVLPETELENAEVIAEGIRKLVERLPIVQLDGAALPSVTVSVGVGQMHSGDSPASLLKRADEALYRVKRSGRNRVGC
ncbi:MAG: GGDEF domain-containing protein [Verrucomicrobia bacterium]|nr:GGDEF domain-containing protein [Verrucomicrobiota bacterium]